MQFCLPRSCRSRLHKSSGLQRALAITMTTVSLGQREYCRYTEISADFERQGIHSIPRPDFTRLPRTTTVTEGESKTK